jgi:hypothetical protein
MTKSLQFFKKHVILQQILYIKKTHLLSFKKPFDQSAHATIGYALTQPLIYFDGSVT